MVDISTTTTNEFMTIDAGYEQPTTMVAKLCYGRIALGAETKTVFGTIQTKNKAAQSISVSGTPL